MTRTRISSYVEARESDNACEAELQMKDWLKYLNSPSGGPLEIKAFSATAAFYPYEGKPWGLLLDTESRIFYPYIGNTIIFKRTSESNSVFHHFEKQLQFEESLSTEGKLLESDCNTKHAIEAESGSKDGLFSDDQIKQYNDWVVDNPFWSALASRVLDHWSRLWTTNSDKTFLDLGCGTGRCTEYLLRKGYRVIGLDLSYGMLQQIAKNDSLPEEKFLLIVGDATEPPIASASIDSILCFGSLHHVSSPQKTFQQISRILKVGGLFQALETNQSPLRFLFDLAMKLIPLWEEEAGEEDGEHQILSRNKVLNWTNNLPLKVHCEFSVYLLPHIFYLFNNAHLINALLSATDVLAKIPLLNCLGGILLVTAKKTNEKRI